MFGQFPIANWLVDKLDTTHSGEEYSLPLEPQYAHFEQVDLGLDQNIILDLDPSSPPNTVDPRAGLLPLLSQEKDALANNMLLEKVSPGRSAEAELSYNNSGVPVSSQDQSNERHSRPKRKHHCTRCDGRFSRARDLHRHVQAKHQPSWEHCPQCGKKLKDRADNRRRHMMHYCKGRQYDLNN